jgi:hypothetical protein
MNEEVKRMQLSPSRPRSVYRTFAGKHSLLQLAIAAGIAFTFLIVWPSAAQAGNYMVGECDASLGMPGGPDLSAQGADGYYIGYGNDCQNSGIQPSFGLLLRAQAYRECCQYASIRLDTPPGLLFHSVDFVSRQGPNFPCGSSGPAHYDQVVSVDRGSTRLWTQSAYESCTSQEGWVHASDATSILSEVACWHTCIHVEGDWAGYTGMKQFHLEVNDSVGPTVALGGSAFAHQTIAGQVGLDISASDVGSGVRTATVDVNGARLASPAASCPGFGGVYGWATQLRPCNDYAGNLSLNTAAAPFHEGQNSLHVCASDVTSVSGTTANMTCVDRTLNVDNTCADSQGAQNGVASSLTSGIENPAGGGQSRSVTLYSNQGTRLTGQLRGGSGGPVANASICLYEQIDAPAEIRQLSQVTKTRSDGGFTLQLPAGPSRDYDVVYRANDTTLEDGNLALRSIAIPSLGVGPDTGAQTSAKRGKGAIRNGQAARFSGTIPGPYAANRVVALEALIGRGCTKRKHKGRSASSAKKRKRCLPNKWRTFKTTRTDARGRYSDTYRFTNTSGVVRYSFRATVPSQSGYPYLEGSSDVRQVVVRG